MTRMAFYEKTQGTEDFKISAYYRKDYVSLHMLCSLIWVTVGYRVPGGAADPCRA